jgi:hypothetical protein
MEKITVTSENILELFGKALIKLKRHNFRIFCETHKKRKAVGYYYGQRCCVECILNKSK